MALAEEARITHQTSLKVFKFRGVALKPKKSQPVIPIPLIGNTPDNTYLFRFFGQTEMVTISFVIVNDGVAINTSGTPVITIAAQIQYLRDEIFTSDFEDQWRFEYAEVFGTGGVLGVMIDLDFDVPIGRPAIRTGTMTFQRGQLISI